jgi:tetratricopeptide (TPR) repeat protein
MDALSIIGLIVVAILAGSLDPSTALPEFDQQWNFADPGATEAKFRAILAAAPIEARDHRLELATQIARCQGLQAKFDAAHATLDEVQKSAPLTPRVRARLLLERGRVFNSAGSPGRALPIFRDAYRVATEAAERRFAIDAAHMIAIAEPAIADQIAWNLKCLDLIDQHPEQDRWRNAIYNNLGEAYRADRQYDRALDCFQKLIARQQATGRPVDRYARVDEAKMLRMVGRPAESLARMQALQREIGAETDGFVAEEQAEALLALGRADEAKPLFRLAWEKLKDEAWLKESEPQRHQRLREMGE